MKDGAIQLRDKVSLGIGIVFLIIFILLPYVWRLKLSENLEFNPTIRLTFGLISGVIIIIVCALANEQSSRNTGVFLQIVLAGIGGVILSGWTEFQANPELTGVAILSLEDSPFRIYISLSMMLLGTYLVSTNVSGIIRKLMALDPEEIERKSSTDILMWLEDYSQYLDENILISQDDKWKRKQILEGVEERLMNKCNVTGVEISVSSGTFNFDKQFDSSVATTFTELHKNYHWPLNREKDIRNLISKEFRAAYNSKFWFRYLQMKFDSNSSPVFTTLESMELLRMFDSYPNAEKYLEKSSQDFWLYCFSFKDDERPEKNHIGIQKKIGLFLYLLYAQYNLIYGHQRVGNIVIYEQPLRLDSLRTIFNDICKELDLHKSKFYHQEVMKNELEELGPFELKLENVEQLIERYEEIMQLLDVRTLLPFQMKNINREEDLKRSEEELRTIVQGIISDWD